VVGCHTFSIQLLPKKQRPVVRPAFAFCSAQSILESSFSPCGNLISKQTGKVQGAEQIAAVKLTYAGKTLLFPVVFRCKSDIIGVLPHIFGGIDCRGRDW
jgi:hypothetical protein